MNNFFNIIKAICAGFLTGILISIPLGPAGIESIKRTISKGYKEGFTVSLGALIADLVYLLLINCGLSNLLNKNKGTESFFWIISGILLSCIGYFSLNRKSNTYKPFYRKNNSRRSLPLLTGFFITFLNPMTPTLWLTLSGTVIRFWYYVSIPCYYTFLLSLWCGMVTWFASLNLFALKGFKILTPDTTDKTTYILMAATSVIGLAFVIFGIINILHYY